MMRRRWVIAGAVVFAILVGGWTALWFYVTGQIHQGLQRFVAQQAASGTQIEYRSFNVGGFPLGWTIRAEALSAVQERPAPRSWQGERLVVDVRPWAPRTLHIRPEGNQQLTQGAAGQARTLIASAAEPDLWVTLGANNRPQQIVAVLQGLQLRGAPQDQPVQIARLAAEIRLLNPPQPSSSAPFLEGQVSLADATLPANVRTFGQRIQRLELQASITGEWPEARTAQAVARWRESGGKIDITRLALTWAPLDVEGDGTLALDQANRPLGAGALRVRGHNETIDALVQARIMRPQEAFAAKLMITPLARPAADGRAQIQAPITAQDGRLSINNIPMLPLPALRFE